MQLSKKKVGTLSLIPFMATNTHKQSSKRTALLELELVELLCLISRLSPKRDKCFSEPYPLFLGYC